MELAYRSTGFLQHGQVEGQVERSAGELEPVVISRILNLWISGVHSVLLEDALQLSSSHSVWCIDLKAVDKVADRLESHEVLRNLAL